MVDDDLIGVTLSIPFQNSFLEGEIVELTWDTTLLNVWDTQTKNNEYTLTAAPDAINPAFDNWWVMGEETLPAVLWVEGDDWGEASIMLELGNGVPGVVDRVNLTVIDLDLDIDSDNNNGFFPPEGSDWEETLEDHPYGLGKLIMLDVTGARPVTPIQLTIAGGLDPDDSTLTVRFDWNAAGPAGWVKLWTTAVPDAARNTAEVNAGGDRVYPYQAYSLDDLNYNPANGMIDVFAEGWHENPTTTTLAGVEQTGKPDERIRATVLVNGGDFEFDEVKYIVANEDSFFYFLQTEQALRAALGSRAIYTRSDMQPFSMQILGNQDLVDLGVPQPIANLLDTEAVHGVAGFNAALYQDFITGEDQFMLTFAGTDDFDDWIANIWQAIGEPTEQFESAMLIADEFIAVNEFSTANVVTSGHSLGGGLASAASVVSGIQGFTFNASGLHVNTLYQRDGNGDPIPDGMGGFLELYAGSVARYNNAGAFIAARYGSSHKKCPIGIDAK